MQRTYATVPPTGSGTPPKKDDSELKRVMRVVSRHVVSGSGPHLLLSVWKRLLCYCIVGSS